MGATVPNGRVLEIRLFDELAEFVDERVELFRKRGRKKRGQIYLYTMSDIVNK